MDRSEAELLFQLWHRLNYHRGDEKFRDPIIERYKYFLDHSQYGENCEYAKKYLAHFLKEDYEIVRDLILQLAEKMR